MAVPKRKPSKSRSRMKRNAGKGMSLKMISYDKETGEPFVSHNITSKGFYKGVRVVEEKVKEEKTENS